MKFNVPSKTLYSYVSAVSKVINSKNALVILNNFLFELDGDTLTITASDLENTLTARVPVTEAEGSGKFCVDARRVVDLLKSMPDIGITFEIDDNSLAIEITYPNGNYSFVGINGNEYPQRNPEDEETEKISFSCPSEQIIRGIDNTFGKYGPVRNQIVPLFRQQHILQIDSVTDPGRGQHRITSDICHTGYIAFF